MIDLVSDMRLLAVTSNETLYYAHHDKIEKPGRFCTLIYRPEEWFLTDLAKLAETAHPDLLLCWIRDALLSAGEAVEIHLFTGAADWRGLSTLVRVHLIGTHGYKYLSFGFVLEPEPRWCVIGARNIQVYKYEATEKSDDDGYAHDATRT